MGGFSYWLVFMLTFLSLCARAGKKAKSDKGFEGLLKRLYEFGSRNRGKDTSGRETLP